MMVPSMKGVLASGDPTARSAGQGWGPPTPRRAPCPSQRHGRPTPRRQRTPGPASTSDPHPPGTHSTARAAAAAGPGAEPGAAAQPPLRRARRGLLQH